MSLLLPLPAAVVPGGRFTRLLRSVARRLAAALGAEIATVERRSESAAAEWRPAAAGCQAETAAAGWRAEASAAGWRAEAAAAGQAAEGWAETAAAGWSAGAAAAAGEMSAGGDGGGPAGIGELYRVRRLGLVRMAVLMVDDLGAAEDIVQEAFAKLWRRHGAELRGVDDPGAYLTTAVLNAARSALRRRRTARAYVLPRAGVAPAAEDLALLGEGDREVLAALGRLTARQRQVVVLRYWSELSEQEIAEALRVSRGTVKSTASRALTILREALGEGRR